MKHQILLLLLFLVPSEACLRVQDATPKCACKVQGLDRDSFSDYTNDTALIQNITSYYIEPPAIITDDCSVSVQCPDQYSLIVLDTDSYTMFGDYSADGFCNPITQTWLVADDGGFSSFSQMNGICVNYNYRCDVCRLDDILVSDPGVKFLRLMPDVQCAREAFVSCSRSDDLECQTIRTWVENENGTYQVGIRGPLDMADVTCDDDGNWKENDQGIPKLTKLYCTFENCA